MKKKLILIVLMAALVFGVSATGMAAKQSSPKVSAAVTAKDDAAQLRQLTAAIISDRQTLLSVESENVQLTLKLRSRIAGLKSKSGISLTRDDLSRLKALQNQIKQLEETIAGTKGQINALTDSYKQHRKAKDFQGAAAALEEVISIQKTRIATKSDINSLLKQMLAILGTA